MAGVRRRSWSSRLASPGAWPPGRSRQFFGGWLTGLARAKDRQPAVDARSAGGSSARGSPLSRHPGQHLDRLYRGVHDGDSSRLAALRRAAPATVLVELAPPAGQWPAPGGVVRNDEHDGYVRQDHLQFFHRRLRRLEKENTWVVTGRAQWDPALYAYVAVALIGMVLWSLINPEKTVESQPA